MIRPTLQFGTLYRASDVNHEEYRLADSGHHGRLTVAIAQAAHRKDEELVRSGNMAAIRAVTRRHYLNAHGQAEAADAVQIYQNKSGGVGIATGDDVFQIRLLADSLQQLGHTTAPNGQAYITVPYDRGDVLDAAAALHEIMQHHIKGDSQTHPLRNPIAIAPVIERVTGKKLDAKG